MVFLVNCWWEQLKCIMTLSIVWEHLRGASKVGKGVFAECLPYLISFSHWTNLFVWPFVRTTELPPSPRLAGRAMEQDRPNQKVCLIDPSGWRLFDRLKTAQHTGTFCNRKNSFWPQSRKPQLADTRREHMYMASPALCACWLPCDYLLLHVSLSHGSGWCRLRVDPFIQFRIHLLLGLSDKRQTHLKNQIRIPD